MARISAVDPKTAAGKAKALLDQIQASFGRTPNMMRTMAHSPALLEGYLNFSKALGGGALSARLREQLALAVSEANSCQYCVSAHTAIGKMVGVDESELMASRHGASTDPRAALALEFARALVAQRGDVTDGDVRRLREASYTDGEIAEIVGAVALNILTNYFNKAAAVEVDFPRVPLVSEPLAATR